VQFLDLEAEHEHVAEARAGDAALRAAVFRFAVFFAGAFLAAAFFFAGALRPRDFALAPLREVFLAGRAIA
jgi:hypothetical protein